MAKNKLDSIFSYWNIFLLSFILLLVLATQSRAGLFLYCISLIFLFRTYIKSFYSKSRYKVILLTATIIFSTALITTLIYLKVPSALGRLFIWQNSFEMFWQKPILGWGSGGFEKSYLDQQATYFKNNLSSDAYKYKMVADSVSSPLNEYLKILVDHGIMGILCLAITIRIIWKFSKNIHNKNEYSFFFTLTLILLSAFVYFTFQSTTIFLVLLLCLAYISSGESELNLYVTINKSVTLLIKGLLFILCSLLFYYSLEQYNATARWKKAINHMESHPEISLKVYKEISNELNHRPAFNYNYGVTLFQYGRYPESVKIFEDLRNKFVTLDVMLYLGKSYQAVKQYNNAEKIFKDASFMVPNRFIPKYNLFRLYHEIKDFKKADAVAQEILTMPVKIPSNEVDSIKNEVKKMLIK
ncbi:hypothetical protein G7074_14675 [Pedobacter sp. HDW13]|uniref:O-antigen ligase family protein n=1 Tax=Pedobacter sp. HDW13 TaxID=2714940 RepID=UPI00140DA476|nr:O-antigen ligase family protein [Pedobacter sp. HDW13]QIL40398.1 hypothetical protein G7074_14675 [Pedobacter sp. HDW13]